MADKWIYTNNPAVFFEDTVVGKMKKELWDATTEDIDKILEEYELPNESEFGKAGCYIQNTPRNKVIEKRRKNDIVLLPCGCTENHGIHNPSGLDTFMVSQICEGVRRYTAKKGYEVSLAFPALNYGGHPYHHGGMPGICIIPEETVRELLVYTIAGLWDDGFRKIILINNHGQRWMMESAVQEFFRRFQVPAFVTIVEWHRAVREFFYPVEDHENAMTTHFLHADEAETAVANLLFGDMVDMSVCVDAQSQPLFLKGFYDNSVDGMHRPHAWSEGVGHTTIERHGTPEGVVGYPSRGTAEKAKRPVAAICRYLTLMIDEILKVYPAGQVPPASALTYRTDAEVEPYLREPMSEGWKSLHELPRIGIF